MCFKLLLPCPQIGNNAWEWSYGKHDEQEFTALNIVWVGTILDRIFWIPIIRVGIFWVGIFQVGTFQVGAILDGNFLWWRFSGWELSGENHPGGSFPSTLFVYSDSAIQFDLSCTLHFFMLCDKRSISLSNLLPFLIFDFMINEIPYSNENPCQTKISHEASRGISPN